MRERAQKSASVTVIAVADADSYLKWVAHTVAQLPQDWSTTVRVVEGAATPSVAQMQAQLLGSGVEAEACEMRTLDALADEIRALEPDVVLLGTRGPTAWLVMERAIATMERRPVVVTGLPGISIPAKRLGVTFRSGADLFLLHSRREIRAYEEIAADGALAGTFALATLPFVADVAEVADGAAPRGSEVIFAAQALVPRLASERMRILESLIRLAQERPDLTVVVKVRAAPGEAQTHAEKDAYPDLLDQMRAEGVEVPSNLVVSAESMGAHLERACGLVTVSSTAAVEAVASGVPTLVLSDFGIRDAVINPVFYRSDLLGNLGDLEEARFFSVRRDWLQDNYFHDRADNDWEPRLEALVARRRESGLPPVSVVARDELTVMQRKHAEVSALGATGGLGSRTVARTLPVVRAVAWRLRGVRKLLW
ncbi:DUF6716 putative glycosyltransferase [Demequina subtropica]|uniref:DUF6716 putative glycosyltransferase n=1 Tax=Demequina subtropica TaxID=1638989 RepID=UPI00078062D5|nr:DUF6716 putative glycosyltransferase [Demequina subtropica]